MSEANKSSEFSRQPNLFILGFMATGKTVLGRRVAKQMGFEFIDIDAKIEESTQMKIPEIFEKFGEAHFRKLEREFVENIKPNSSLVISGGGGICCVEGMPELIKSKGISVVLFASEDEILERASLNKSRPLLNVENPQEKIKELLKSRLKFYTKSGVSMMTSKKIEESEARILKIYDDIRRIKKKSFKKDA